MDRNSYKVWYNYNVRIFNRLTLYNSSLCNNNIWSNTLLNIIQCPYLWVYLWIVVLWVCNVNNICNKEVNTYGLRNIFNLRNNQYITTNMSTNKYLYNNCNINEQLINNLYNISTNGMGNNNLEMDNILYNGSGNNINTNRINNTTISSNNIYRCGNSSCTTIGLRLWLAEVIGGIRNISIQTNGTITSNNSINIETFCSINLKHVGSNLYILGNSSTSGINSCNNVSNNSSNNGSNGYILDNGNNIGTCEIINISGNPRNNISNNDSINSITVTKMGNTLIAKKSPFINTL